VNTQSVIPIKIMIPVSLCEHTVKKFLTESAKVYKDIERQLVEPQDRIQFLEEAERDGMKIPINFRSFDADSLRALVCTVFWKKVEEPLEEIA
jgi:hypothetical protein